MERGYRRAGDEGSLRGSRGFVLAEIIIALAIFLLLSAAVVSVFLTSLRMWREGSAQVALQRKLAAAMQRIVQGERGRAEERQHGLREARGITVVDTQTIEFTSDVDNTTRRFYLNGNEILYDPDANSSIEQEETIYDPSRSEDPLVTSNYRSDLQFTQLPDGTIEIRLVGEERVRGRWINAALVTKVTPRNVD